MEGDLDKESAASGKWPEITLSDKRLTILCATGVVVMIILAITFLALFVGPWGKSEEASSFGMGALVQSLATMGVIGITELYKFIRGEPPQKETPGAESGKE